MKAVILAGGSGSRLWPISRENKPKQFQKLTSSKTMIQETLDRLDFLNKKDTYIATNSNYLELVKEQCPNVSEDHIIIEPAVRDTAPCIGLSAIMLEHKYPGEVLAVIYSDHLIKNKKEFIQKLKVAEKTAKKENAITILEVKAKFANSNLGYVKIGKMLHEIEGCEIYELKKFIEKPDLKTAQTYVDSFKYLWNTGYYVFRTDILLSHYKKFQPEIYQRLMIIKRSLGTKSEHETIQKEYAECPKISIDYGIMEKIPPQSVRIIPADFDWSDVGTFEALYSELSEHPHKNISSGQHLCIDAKGCLIYNETKQLIACFGMKNTVIVNTKDALLICPKEKSVEIKKLIEIIKKKHSRLL